VHLCHLSTARAVALVVAARARGARATCETCPHYLLLSDEDAEEIGALAKGAPPLRSTAERAGLLAAVSCGSVDLVGSDHSPSPASLKGGDDLFAAWGGISGAQTLLTGTLTAGVPLALVPALLGAGPASLLGVADSRGALTEGRAADIVLLDPARRETLAASALHYRHPHSPLVGRTLRGRVVVTFLRGARAGAGHEPRGQYLPRPGE
jgi:allantoinase